MSDIFKPVEIVFCGNSWTVPANQVLGLIAAVEDYVTLADLYNGPKTTAVANAYAAAIRHAGGQVTVAEVYQELFDPESNQSVRGVVESLMMMMIPPKHLQEEAKEEPKKKN